MNTIRLKIRDLEVEGIGFDSFEKFEPILNRAVEIWKGSGGSTANSATTTPRKTDVGATSEEFGDISINSFIVKVGGESCRDLLKASAGYLTIVQSQERINHDDLVATAKQSTRWKKDFSANVNRDIKRMIDHGEITENATKIYSLPLAAVEEMRSMLSNG